MDGDSQELPGVTDLPNEPTEYEGILHGLEFNTWPTHFLECETSEIYEVSYAWQQGEVWKGSCYGVYNRVRGHLDRSFDPPRLVVQETLEARWCEPSDCATECEPHYESCVAEETPDSGPDGGGFLYSSPCEPLSIDPCGDARCIPERFEATEFAGWKHFVCAHEVGTDGPKQPCEFVNDSDTCIESWRCWNPAGDITKPGVCMHYCDLNDAADSCAGIGTCVRCSSSDRWGLCMTDCSGEDCNVDAFC